MEIVLFIVIGIVLLAGFVLAQFFVRNLWHYSKFQRIAKRFSGRLQDASWFEFPTIQLRVGRFEAHIYFFSTGNAESETKFRAAWPDAKLECELRQPSVMGRVVNLLMSRPISLAAPLLDNAYIVTGNDEQQIRRLFSASVQSSLIQLSELAPVPYRRYPDVRVTIENGLFTIAKPSHIVEELALEQFIRLSSQLHRDALDSAGQAAIRSIDNLTKSCA